MQIKLCGTTVDTFWFATMDQPPTTSSVMFVYGRRFGDYLRGHVIGMYIRNSSSGYYRVRYASLVGAADVVAFDEAGARRALLHSSVVRGRWSTITSQPASTLCYYHMSSYRVEIAHAD